jgi:hypothetical protein
VLAFGIIEYFFEEAKCTKTITSAQYHAVLRMLEVVAYCIDSKLMFQQNSAIDSTGFSLRRAGVQLAPFNLTMEIISRQRGRFSRNYFEFIFLALRLFWNLLEVGTILNWNFRYGK